MTFPNGLPMDEAGYWAALDERTQPPMTAAENMAASHTQWHRENGMAGCPWDCAASELYLLLLDDEPDDAIEDQAAGDTGGNQDQVLVEPPARPGGYEWPSDVEPPF